MKKLMILMAILVAIAGYTLVSLFVGPAEEPEAAPAAQDESLRPPARHSSYPRRADKQTRLSELHNIVRGEQAEISN